MIVVTTPTGAIGGQLVTRLLAAGAPLRLIARDPSHLPAAVRDRAEVVSGSHGDPDVVAKAFAGADTVFWLVPPDPRAPSVDAAYSGFSRPACEAFTAQGVRRVVGVSAIGRNTPVAAHAGYVTATHALDDRIAATGVAYRALTMPAFMDNLLRQVASLRDQGTFYGPLAPDLAMPTCATADIAATAATLLLDSSWTGRADVPVLGPEDLSQNDLARIASEVLDRPIRYHRVPRDDFKATLLRAGLSDPMAQGMLDMMVAADAGLNNAEPRTPQSGSPTTFRQWCEEVLRPAVRG
jgi:uncharacterized protein YbjT (DUF2867 family)